MKGFFKKFTWGVIGTGALTALGCGWFFLQWLKNDPPATGLPVIKGPDSPTHEYVEPPQQEDPRVYKQLQRGRSDIPKEAEVLLLEPEKPLEVESPQEEDTLIEEEELQLNSEPENKPSSMPGSRESRSIDDVVNAKQSSEENRGSQGTKRNPSGPKEPQKKGDSGSRPRSIDELLKRRSEGKK